MIILCRQLYFFLVLLVSVTSFQTSLLVKSVYVTKFREKRRKSDSGQIRVTNGNNSANKAATTAFLSNDGNNIESNGSYNDDAFGFVFLGSYFATQDSIFAGTFLLLSALAATATRNGKLPASKIVPAAVAGCTLLTNLILPSDKLYELFPFIGRPESSLLPLDSSWVQAGLCSVSIIYGFVSSSFDDKE